MQAKKRAKPVKFGGKPETAHSTKEQVPPISDIPGGVHQSGKSQDRQEEVLKDQTETATGAGEEKHVDVVIESKTEETQIIVSETENQNAEQKLPEENLTEQNITAPAAEQNSQSDIQTSTDETLSQPPQNLDEAEKPQSEAAGTPESEQQADNSLQGIGDNTFFVEKRVQKSVLGFFILIAVISFMVGLVSMAGANYFFNNKNFADGFPLLSKITTAPTAAPTNEPTPTVEAVNPAEYKIGILNGSGITGLATKLKTSLIASGFDVATVGNADNNNFTNTVITAGKNIKSGYLAKLKEELEKTYIVTTETSSSSATKSDADLTITIGSKTVSQ